MANKKPPDDTVEGFVNDSLPGDPGGPMWLGRAFDVFRRERQRTATLATGSKNRIANGGLDDCGTRFAQPTWCAVALDEVNVEHLRSFIDACNTVHIEVGLFDPAVAERDFAPHASRLTEIDRALHLRKSLIRMHQGPGIDYGSDLLNRHVVVGGHAYFGDHRNHGVVAFHHRYAHAPAIWQFLAPARFGADFFQNALHTGADRHACREARPLMFGGSHVQHINAVLDWIFARCIGKLIDEALKRNSVQVMRHPAPISRRHPSVVHLVRELHIWRIVGIVIDAFDGKRIDAILNDAREQACRD